LLCLLLTANAFATDYYVSTTGNDATNDGRSVESPYATIQKAADAAVPGDVVYVLAGTYREQVEIKSNGVTFRPYGSDEVTLNGADLMLNWTPVAGATYQTTMDWNLTQTWGSNQVFQDGVMINLARWPDQTSTDLVKPTNGVAEDVIVAPKSGGNYGNWIEIKDNDFNDPAARWVGAKIWINLSRLGSGLDGQGWTGTVKAINGTTIRVEGVSARPSNEAWGFGKGTEYFMFDPLPAAVEATGGVDALLGPGEWWKNGNTLYVKTRSGAAPASDPAETSNLIEAKRRYFAFWPAAGNRSGYTIQDFNLFGCAITTDRNAISSRRIADEAHDITLSGLTVKYPSHLISMAGNWQDEHYNFTGIVLSGRNNVLKDSDISLSATSAISFSGANNKLLNNRIHETNYMCSNSGAVNTGFVCMDSEIAYNKIWNTTMMGINIKFFKGSNPEVKHTARVHHNEIFDFMRRSHDSSAIDVVGSDLQWARIDHNVIYNTLADARVGTRKYGIYLDYGGGGVNRIRATVDHNVVWDVNNPMTVNTGWDVHIFNNVFMAVVDRIDHKEEKSTALTITLKLGEAVNAGKNIRVYNNILNEEPYLSQGPNPFISILNNITDARGEKLAELFVDATNPVMSARDYHLKETAAAAIDKGVSVEEFTQNYAQDAAVQGVTDLGAYEWGTFLAGPDTEAPAVPAADKFVVSEKGASSFRLRWEPSADNVGVAFYEVYTNGKLFKQTGDTTLLVDGLTLSTTYHVAVMAIDGSGNRSELSSTLEVKTILNNITLAQTTTAPVVDGAKDAAWGETLPVANVLSTAPASAADASGGWTSLWDANNLYIYIDANDDENVVDSGNSWWEDDHIELYIDADGSRPNGYTNMQFQYAVRRGANAIIDAKPWFNRSIANIQVANVEKPNGEGYTVEIKIPFANLGVAAEAYKFIGIDVQIGDDDNGGSEDTRLGWFSTLNNVHQNPSLMALAQLVEAGKTDDIKPTVPTNLKASAVTPNGFTISWAASADNFAVLSYEVFVNGNLVATPSGTSLTLPELTEGTPYAVQVKAKDRFGNLSEPSSVLHVMTPTRDSGVRYEAELAGLTAGTMTVSSAESGFSGTGYVMQSPTVGAAITFAVNVPKAGAYPVVLRYSGNSRFVPYVNGTAMTEIRLSGTPTPNDWTDFTVLMTLKAGANTIMYRYESGDNFRRGNLDYILLYPVAGADSEAPGVPADVTVSNITHTGFTLSWTASTDDSGVAPEYAVYQDGVLAGTTTATTYDVTTLPGTYGMTVKAVDAAGNQSDASDNTPVTTVLRGVVTREVWTNITGTLVSDIPVHTKPASSTAVYSLEDPTLSSSLAQYNNFGQRIRGYIIPSATATYYFYIAADNTGEFWLSTDEQPANKGTAPVAFVKNTKAREWDKELRGQKSAGIALVAGKKYYFEALMKEFDGGNNLSVGWTTDTRNKGIAPIGGDNIEAYVPSVPVVWMMVSPKGAGLTAGETRQIKATIYPGNATNQVIAWTSSNPAVVTVDNAGLVTGAGLGSATVTASVENGKFTAAAEFSVEPPTVKGVVVQEVWRFIGDGRTVASIPLTRTPNIVREITSIEDPTPNLSAWDNDQYGQRIRGYIIPSTTATYYFYIASDDNGQLWLSSDYNPANKGTAPIAHITGNNPPDFNNGGTGQREWQNAAHAAFQKSAGKALIAGKKYYFEALMKERYGFNHLAIGWTTTTNNTGIAVIGSDNIGKYLGEGCAGCRPDAAAESKGQTESLGLKLQPNPADRQVTIDLSGFAGESAVQVKMTDVNGKLFVSQHVELGAGKKQVTVPVSHLAKGLFVVTVQGGKTAKTAKLAITR
jgi:hypothetical protein